jgi:hypothetical protein
MAINKNRRIEIYFVLYLAAIIFLLPDKGEYEKGDNEGVTVLQGPFSLQPVKTSLTCRFETDTSGQKIILLDSTNTIIITGKYEDLEFSYLVEDLITKQRQNISRNSKYFKFEENLSKGELKFIWEPYLKDNKSKTYVVKVRAKGKEKGLDNEESTYIAETQFSVIITNISIPEIDTDIDGKVYANNLLRDNENLNYGIGGDYYSRIGEISLYLDEVEVRNRAYENWENKIFIFGASAKKDLLGKPEIETELQYQESNGTAVIQEYTDNYIKIGGKTPSMGRMKVKVSMMFSTRERKEIDFSVKSVLISVPKYEKIMYPEKTYIIEPNLPFLPGQNPEAFIKDKNVILKRSPQGENISFTPELAHVGKELVLERYIDNKIYDRYYIRVEDYPDPVIYKIQEEENRQSVQVTTRSSGYFNRRKNEAKLEVKGNAEVFPQRGKISESDEITIIQYFRITPINKDISFSFQVKAVDLRGRSSETKSWPPSE